MCRHFLHPQLTLGKPFFHSGHFSIQIQTGTYLTAVEKTWFTKVGSRKFQTNIKSKYHRQNPRASCPFTFFSSRFKNLPVFLHYNLLIVNFILLKLLCSSSQMISWKTLIPAKLQFSLLWTCPQPLILWTTLLFFIDSSILSVYLVMLSHGFVRI